MGAPYQYIVVKDANSRGVIGCQSGHAAGESMVVEHVRDYNPADIHIVLLAANHCEDLEALGRALVADGIPHAVIRETDPPYNGQATAVGISPTRDRDRIRPFVEQFKVLR